MSELKAHIALASDMDEFEKLIVSAFRNRRDMTWEGMKGTTPNAEAQKKYDTENYRVQLLEGIQANVRIVLGEDAVRHEHINRLLKGVEELGIMKKGQVRTTLLKEQAEKLTELINKLKESVA